MSSSTKIRIYAWVELLIWIIIISVSVFCIRYHHYKSQKQYKSYQIFLEDVDGLIVGSPVRYMGVQIGYVKKIEIVSSQVYIKFAITEKNLSLPVGVMATVEAFGMAGSKSLELYPPVKDVKTDKIIVTKDPTRLGKVMTLFDDMFKQIDSIIVACSHASILISPDLENYDTATLGESKTKFTKFSESVKYIMNTRKELSKKSKENKPKEDNKDGFIESSSNK